MKLLTSEWVEKAEGDFATVGRELRARKAPNYDSACFHSQQCAEKYLKALLQEADILFGKTHNLITLLNLVLPVEPGFASLQPELIALTTFAVDFRYPGSSADRATAREAFKSCREVRKQARLSLGLEP